MFLRHGGGMFPGRELIERGRGVACGQASERGGQPCLRVGAVQFAGLDKRSDHRPVVAAVVGAGEQGIFAVERQSPFILPMSATLLKFTIAGIPVSATGPVCSARSIGPWADITMSKGRLGRF